MSLPNSGVGATGTNSLIKNTATSPQQNALLPNPFDLKDSEILEKVHLTHVTDDELCHTDIIFELVSSVVTQSNTKISVTSFKPEFRTLKMISCQMIATRNAAHCAHQTTLWILQKLRSYSWDAKAFITLAAFTLEYGNYLHLNSITTTDIVGNSLKKLNQINSRRISSDITELVNDIVHMSVHLQEWANLSSEGYDPENVPALAEALQEIPLLVYWTIASLVASTGNLLGVSDYNLSDYRKRFSIVVPKLVTRLSICKQQISKLEDECTRIEIFKNPKDIVDLLKALIHRNGTDSPSIYEGNVLVKSGLEIFKQKHVMLFISSLDSVRDEILLLNSLYEKLQAKTKEVQKDFKKEDFRILWIPIVKSWDEENIGKFKALKSLIKWHLVEYFSELPGLKIIKDKEQIGYVDSPIIPVYNPQGNKTNVDAMELIFQWGLVAFPFRTSDGNDLFLKWEWLWKIINKATPGLLVKGDRYIFIYGGTNNKWIQDFTTELDKVKRHESVKRADVIIVNYQLGKDDPKLVHNFWTGIQMKKLQNKKHQDTVDCKIQEVVKNLFCLRRNPHGWIILSKGNSIKLLGHGEPAYQTLVEFPNWKDKLLEKEGFDIAFQEYYEVKAKETPDREQCEVINVDTYSSNVVATISCPNPMCGRVMEVSSVHYKCCHRDEPNDFSF